MSLPEAPDDGGGGGGGGNTPPSSSPDWARIATFAAGVTDYKGTNFSYLDTGTLVDLAGTYTVLSVTSGQIVLSNPALVNPSWDNIGGIGDATTYASPALSTSGERWIGPFVCDLENLDRMLINLVALQGDYMVNKKGKQYARNDSVLIEITPVDPITDLPIGPAETFFGGIGGADDNKDPIGISVWCNLGFTGPCQVRARRTSPTDLDDEHTVVDEIRWRDAYGMSAVSADHFGDVTTVHVRTYATNSALSVKDRQFNLLATRMLPKRVSGSEFTPELYATDSVDDILSAMALDPYIGRRKTSEMDFDSIYDEVAAATEYFGTPLATSFGLTFDDKDQSFEESAQIVAQSAFCIAYRQGSVIRLKFEQATDDSTLLFNARNIIPDSQTMTYRFGVLDDNDGIELAYTDPKDGSKLTYYIPTDRSAVSPRSIDATGTRSYQLAFWQAWRAWDKLRYQSLAVEFVATQEAELVIPQDRILVADRTRPGILQGEIEAEDGLILQLSLPATLDPDKSWIIFLQHIDGTTESLGVTGGADPYHVVIARAPRMALSIDAANYARATYMIVPDDDVSTRAFLLSEREPDSGFTQKLTAVNYTFLYYQHDELVLWLAFLRSNYLDSGPYNRDGTPSGGGAIVADDSRGLVYQGAGAGSKISFANFTQPVSYTKAAWIKRGDMTSAGSILGSAHETFGFAAGPNIQAGHDGVAISAAWPGVEFWQHVVLTYDADEGTMALYINGGLAGSADDVPTRTLAQLTAFDGYVGLGSDLRLWKRALSAGDIATIYRSIKNSVTTGGGLLTEDNRTLTTEDGHPLILE